MPISIRELSIEFRGVPENLSPVEQKSCELRHLIELQSAMFRIIALQSIEQAWLHIEPNRLMASGKIESIDRAWELFGDLGASIAETSCQLADELAKLKLPTAAS